MRDPKFVSVAAKVFTLPQQYPCSRKKSVSTNLRKNKSEIHLTKSKLLRRGKARLFKQGKVATPFRTRKHVQTTARTKVSKKQMKRPKKFVKTTGPTNLVNYLSYAWFPELANFGQKSQTLKISDNF